MDEDHVGKQQDLYLWCFVGGSKNWGLWGCPMLFTSGCPCTISIPVVPAPSALQRRGIISLFSFMDTIIRGAILARIGLGASQFQPLEDISCITVAVEILKMWNPVRASLNIFHIPPHFLLIAAQMETIVWFCAQPQLSHSILCTRQLWAASLWTSCVARDLGKL